MSPPTLTPDLCMELMFCLAELDHKQEVNCSIIEGMAFKKQKEGRKGIDHDGQGLRFLKGWLGKRLLDASAQTRRQKETTARGDTGAGPEFGGQYLITSWGNVCFKINSINTKCT